MLSKTLHSMGGCLRAACQVCSRPLPDRLSEAGAGQVSAKTQASGRWSVPTSDLSAEVLIPWCPLRAVDSS